MSLVAAAPDILEQVEESLVRALDDAPVFAHYYNIAGQRLRLRFVGAALHSALAPALAHLQSGAAAADLSVDVFVSPTVPVAMPDDDWLAAARAWKNTARRQAFMHYALDGDDRLTLLHRPERRGFVCYKAFQQLSSRQLSAPFRELFNAWFQLSAGQLVHGAAVANAHGAVLFAGASGSGKSNTALACLSHPELSHLADDLCLIQLCGNDAIVHGLYNSVKLWPHDQSRYASLPSAARTREDDKPVCFLFPAWRDKIADAAPLKAILLPRLQGNAETCLRPAAQADAWRAIAPSTLSFIPGNDAAALQWIAALVKRVPILWLDLGRRREPIADVIHQFLST